MTSTNDGREVKINQTSGPKGKAHYIELFKSLDTRLTEAILPSERTKHLCEAWRRIHDICLHSTASAHDHLLSWLQRHTARVVLQTAWQRPDRKDDRASLEEAINFLIHEVQTTAASRNGPSPPWEADLAERGDWFKRILEHPWQHPVLTRLLNASETPPSDDEVLEWLKEERGITFVVRLQTLAAEKQCDDIAMTLATTVMDRARRDEPPSDCHETKEQSERPTPAFGVRLKEHAGFTTDIWELLVDIEFVLLHKRDSARCIDLAKQTPLRSAHNLIERLQSRQDTSPRDKRLWRSAKEVAMLIAQVVITRCMMVPQCKGDARTALYRCAHSLARLTPVARLPAAAAALAAPAPTAAHLHLLAAALDAQLAQKNEVSMKPFLCELYVRAITAGMNELERLKLKTEKEKEARAMEQTLASWLMHLGAVLGSNTRFKHECALTAFSLHPSPQMYEQIKAAPHLSSINLDTAEETSSEATNPEFGSWASDSRSQTNLVKTSETLKMKTRQNHVNVLSTAILNECEGLGLSLELCQDITVLLSGPRVKTLSWDMDRELLLENCRGYLERTHGGTKALTTELKYLNLKPEDFQYLPEEDDDENSLYYGIEKGYEHLVETEPEEMWEDINDFPQNADKSYSSDEFEYTTTKQRRKKTKKPVSNSDEDDPLSQVAEAKRKEKKERPHSKERSKEKKRDKSEKKPPVDPLDFNADTQKKEKPKRERKKKEKAPKPISSLSNLVGLKVAKPRKKKNATYNDVNSQLQSSIQSSYSEENIIYDGQFSMDEMRSPRSATHSADGMRLTQNEFSMANGKMRVSKTHQHQSMNNRQHQTPSVSRYPAPPSEHSRNKSPSHVSDDVRNSISRLMEFRRLKALENERRKPNAIIRPGGMPLENNVSPKGVAIPEIPKSYINKQQSDKLRELKKEVDNILKERHKSSAIPSPVIQYASKNTISSPPCQSYYATPTKYNMNAETPPSQSYTPAPEHRPDRFTDSVNYISIYDKDEPSYSQNPFPAPIPNNIRRPSNASTADVNYQDYLHEFHKQGTYNHYAEKAALPKKVIRPSSRISPVVPKTKSEHKTSLPSAKPIPQKPEGSLNTFSRMNYYKNKQTDTKKSQDMTQQSIICDKLDDFILEHLLKSKQTDEQRSQLRAAQTSNNSYVVPGMSTKAKDHPAISSILQNTSTTPALDRQTATPRPTIHQSDQRDFLQFLQRQNVDTGPSISSLPPSNRHCASQSNLGKPSNPQIGIQATNYPMIKPNQPKKPKGISIISSSVIKTAVPNKALSSYPVTKKPSQRKPRKQENRVQKPAKPETTIRKTPEEWENVMNAILKQKTPYRGPNALEVALNKSSFEKAFEESLKKPTKLFKSNVNMASDRISRIEYNRKELVKITKTKTVSSTTSEETISITERKTHAVLTTEVTHPSQTKNKSRMRKKSNSSGETPIPINQVEKCLQKHNINTDTLEKLMRQNSIQIYRSNSKTAQNELPVKASKAQSNIKPNDNIRANVSMIQAGLDLKQDAKQMNVTTKHDTRPNVENNTNDVQMRLLKDTQSKQVEDTSGIPSSDYDLLEELMDDDLRKEIGELSSDEESYNAAAQGFLNNAKIVQKPVSVVYNEPSNNVAAKAPQDCAHPPICKQNMQKQIYAQNTSQQWSYKKNPTGLKTLLATVPTTSTMSFSTASPHNVTTHIVTHPVQVSTFNANMTQITVQPNLYMAATPRPVPVQNVMLFSPTLVYENYGAVQAQMQAVSNETHIAVNVAPNSNLYQTNQFATPVAGPQLISSAVTHVLVSAPTVPFKPSTVTVVNSTEYLDTSSKLHQPTYKATANENVIIESNLSKPTYVASAQENIVSEGKKLKSMLVVSSSVQIPNGIENKPEIRTASIDTNVNKSCERKVLKEVQEKQTDEKIDCKRRAQKSIEKDLKTEADTERLIKKRMAIINRKVSHVCGIQTIALGYSPLRVPSPTLLHDDKDTIDEDHPMAINNIQELDKDIKSPATPDSLKENKMVAQVRRILLRSSNKLKNKNSPSTSSKIPSDKKVAPVVSSDTLTNTTVQNDHSDAGTNSKQKRVSKRIRNKSAISKDNSISEAKVIRKVPSKKATATKMCQDDSANKINVLPLTQTSELLDIEEEILGSTISKTIPINLLSTLKTHSENSSIGTKEYVKDQTCNKDQIIPSAFVSETNQLLDKDLPEPETITVDIPPTNVSGVTAEELAAKAIDVVEQVKVVDIPTTEASISDAVPTDTTLMKDKMDLKLVQDKIPTKEESEPVSKVFTNTVENTDKKVKARSTSIDNKTLNNAPEKADSLQDHENIVPSTVADDDDDVEIIEGTTHVPTPTCSPSDIRNSPQLSFTENDIKIEEIIDPDNSDPLKKKVRIKLANGQTFKGTISGSINFQSLLENPEIKSILMCQFQQPKKLYSLKLNLNKDCSNGTKIIPYVQYQESKPVETVSLLSDDEDEDSSQVFSTEFGRFKINTIDSNIFMKHQHKLMLKCNVRVQKLSEEVIRASKQVSESPLPDCVIPRKDAPQESEYVIRNKDSSQESECVIRNKDTTKECVIPNEDTPPQECVILNKEILQETPQACVMLNEETLQECVILNEETPQACVTLNEDTPQKCVILKEESPRECVMLNEDIPQECVILRQETLKQCVILNENTPRECVMLNKDIPQECAILNEDTPQECVILNEDTPRECVMLNEDIPQSCAILNEDTPQECVILNKDTPRECVMLNEDTSQECDILNKDSPQECVILNKDSPQECDILNKDSPQECVILNKDTPRKCVMLNVDIPQECDILNEDTLQECVNLNEESPQECVILNNDSPQECDILNKDSPQECVILNKDSPQECVILNKDTPHECVILNKDIPQECDILNEDTLQECVNLNEDSPQECVILNKDSPQECVILNKDSPQECVMLNEDIPQECDILNKDTLQECVNLNEDSLQECIDPSEDNTQEYVVPNNETHECVITNETTPKDPQILSTVPSKYVEGISKDFENILAPLNAREKLEEPIVLIDDDSSNDSVDIAMEKIDVLKNMLLKDLGVESPTSKSSEDVQVTWASEAIDLTDDVIMELSDSSSDEEANDYQEIINKKCFVKLVRCDYLLNQPATGKLQPTMSHAHDLWKNTINKPDHLVNAQTYNHTSNEDEKPDDHELDAELKSAPISRSGSISILEDFLLDDDLLQFDRTSPVMEVYDIIASMKAQYPEHIRDLPVEPIECESEWVTSIKMNQLQSMNDLAPDCHLSRCESEWTTTKKMNKVRSMYDLIPDCHLSKCTTEWLTAKKIKKVQSVNDLTADNYMSKCDSEWLTTKKINKVQSVNDLTADNYMSKCDSEWNLFKCESEWLTTKKMNKVQSMYDLTTDGHLFKCTSEWLTTKKMYKFQSVNNLTTHNYLSKCDCESEWLTTKKMNKVQSVNNLTTDYYASKCESDLLKSNKVNKHQSLNNLVTDCHMSKCESEWTTTKKMNKLQTLNHLTSDCYMSKCESEWMTTKKDYNNQSINNMTNGHISESFVVPKLATLLLKFIQQGNLVNKYYGEMKRLSHVSLKRKLKPSTLPTAKISKFNDSPDISVSNGSSDSLFIVGQADLVKTAVYDQASHGPPHNVYEDKDNLHIDTTTHLTKADVKILSVSVSYEDDDDSFLTENETKFAKIKIADEQEYCINQDATLDLTDTDVTNLTVSVSYDDEDSITYDNEPKIEKTQIVDHEEVCINQDATPDLTDTDVTNLKVSVSYDDEDSIIYENEPKIEKNQVVREENCTKQDVALNLTDTDVANLTVSVFYDDEDSLLTENETIFIKSSVGHEDCNRQDATTCDNDSKMLSVCKNVGPSVELDVSSLINRSDVITCIEQNEEVRNNSPFHSPPWENATNSIVNEDNAQADNQSNEINNTDKDEHNKPYDAELSKNSNEFYEAFKNRFGEPDDELRKSPLDKSLQSDIYFNNNLKDTMQYPNQPPQTTAEIYDALNKMFGESERPDSTDVSFCNTYLHEKSGVSVIDNANDNSRDELNATLCEGLSTYLHEKSEVSATLCKGLSQTEDSSDAVLVEGVVDMIHGDFIEDSIESALQPEQNSKEIEQRRFYEDPDSYSKESRFKEILKNVNDEEKLECLNLRVPKRSYGKKYHSEIITRSKGIKRKKNIEKVNTSEKKYRKGKNIDYPKMSTESIANLAYATEYKRLIDYTSGIKFSCKRAFHLDIIDVEKNHEDYPILAIHSDEIKESDISKQNLYSDTEDERAIGVTDPLKLTLNDEIVNGDNVPKYNSIEINEINFSKGFGEKSGRVIQKIETGNTKLSAATLSDVKQYQPFPMSEKINTNLKQNQEIDTQKVNLQLLDLINMKQKIKSIFKKTIMELSTEMLHEKKYADNKVSSHLSMFPFDLTSTEFMEVPCTESIVNVVQVGQMTNATAQNPVTCDPRVTHVSDASPSQCSENSNGEGLQSNMETEYTELTTANIGLPLLQEYSQHQQLTYEGQNSEGDGNGTLSIVKIELMEEDVSREKQENDRYEHNFCPLPNTNVEYSFDETSNTFHSNSDQNADIAPSNLYNTSSNNMDSTLTHVFTCSSNIDGSYTNLETSSSIDSSYASMENASTTVYSTLSNVGSSSNEMEISSNLSDTSSNINDTANLETRNIENPYPNMYSMGTESKDLSHNLSNIDSSNMDDSHLNENGTNNETTAKYEDRAMENTAYDYTYENIEYYAANVENNNNGNSYSANVENYSSNAIHENFPTNVDGFDSNSENYGSNTENYSPGVENYPTNIDSCSNVKNYEKNNTIERNLTNGNSSASMLEDSQPQDLSMANSTKRTKSFKDKGENELSKTDQLAHAMSAAGISSESVIACSPDELVSLISQGIQSHANNYTKQTQSNQQINVLTLQQALAQVLPPPLNQNSPPENQVPNNPAPSQVLHIMQGNNDQTVINKPNGTHLLHIVQNKSNPTINGQSVLVDAGLQQGGNQLIHFVNNGNQNNAQFLKRVNLLTNLQNSQGSNEQKMIQLVCKSPDGKSIQLNTSPQRSMVLRLHPSSIQTAPKPPEPQNRSSSPGDANTATNQGSPQEIKSRSMYEENYAQFIHNSASSPEPSTSPCQEKSTSLPKFNQVFGKQSYQDNPEMNHDGLQETPECVSDENNVHVEQPNEPNNPPSVASNTPPESTQAQLHSVQQIKQATSPMNIQTIHGGVIYTRQIPVNIGGGQTINLITVPSTEMVDDSPQKQQPDGVFVNQEEPSSIIKLVPRHLQNNQNVTGESSAQAEPSNEPQNTPPSQTQPVLTQMRIKLPMLSKGPHIVPGTRLVRPFFQIQRNVISGSNQPVQLVLTAAPSLSQTIRLPAPSPQAQPILVQAAPHSLPSPHIPVQQVQHAPTSHHNHSGQQGPSAPPTTSSVQSDIKEEPGSDLNNLTLEQLREFDMVLEQVKERSVHPLQLGRSCKKPPKPEAADSSDGTALVATSACDSQQQVIFSADNSQPANIVSYVNRKSTITASTSFARSPDSSGIMDMPSSSTLVHVTATVSAKSSSDGGTTVAPPPKKKKKKKSSIISLSQNNPLKPQEDEQTTQRILYILAEYKEQVENSPEKNKPAPRRRNLFPPTTGSRRKRSHCSSRSACKREGAEMSPIHEHGENGEDSLITLGSEDSSCGTTFSECADCQESHSPEDCSAKVVRRLTFEHETTTQTITQTRTTLPQQNAGESQTITVARTTTAASSTPPKPATTVLMPANYLLPVSMIKGGQQIAIMTNRGPRLLVGSADNNTGAFLFQRLIGTGLKPVLTRPGVRHIRLPATALHNLQAFNIQTTPMTQVQPPDSTAPPPMPEPPDLVETRAVSSPWPDREASDKQEREPSPDCTEPWNLPSSSIADDYGYEEIVRTDNMERTVLDAIPDRYSPDMEAQRIFDKMFDVDSKKSMYSPRSGYDIDTSDGDDKPYPQVVQQRKDGRHHRVTHVSTSALRHNYAILEHELLLQKSLSEECEDLGVDSPSASDLFPEADILFGAPSPAHEQTIDQCSSPPPVPIPEPIPQPAIEEQIETNHLITTDHATDDLDLIDDVGEIVTVGEDGTAMISTIDVEEFAKSHPNTTFHTEPEEGEITIAQPPFTIAHGVKRQITFHANRAPSTVVIAPQSSVISQATVNSNNSNNTVKFTNIDNIINAIPGPQNVKPSVVVKDGHQNIQNTQNQPKSLKKVDSLKEPGPSTRQVTKLDMKEPTQKPLSKFDSLLHESKLRLNQSYQGRQVSGTQVIRRLDTQRRFSERDRPNHRSNSRFFFEEPPRTTPNLKHIAEEMRLRNDRALVESMGDNASSPGPELFWDGPEKRYPLNDSEKVAKTPFDELLNDSSAYGPHTRLDSVIKAARSERTYERTTFEGIGVGSDESRPLRTYPAKRPHTQQAQDTQRHFPVKSTTTTTTTTTIRHQEDRKVTHDVSKKTPRCPDTDTRKASRVGMMAKGKCTCCSTVPPPKRRSRAKKPKT